MTNYSPLRYPGGKASLYPVILKVIESQKEDVENVYIEPFAGGAGIACRLLVENKVDYVIINDADKAVYSFWRAIMESSQWFINKIATTPLTIEEWKRQKEIFKKGKKYSKELGFATFYLNRTNRSGILDAGPIGGYAQQGNYKMDCRFNRKNLILKIERLSKEKRKIKIYNQDIFLFLKRYLPTETENRKNFIYFDPPYYEKGQRLYLNHFSTEEHNKLKHAVAKLTSRWIMTYDDEPVIEQLYSEYSSYRFSINYSLANKKKGGELMICKDDTCKPNTIETEKLPQTICFEQAEQWKKKKCECRFCEIAAHKGVPIKKENTKIAENEDYFAIASIGALVEGWTLVIPKKHQCSMKKLYREGKFRTFTNDVIHVLCENYGTIVAFEHGPNREGSETSCGTDHAHIHLVPYKSIKTILQSMELTWIECNASDVETIVGNNEYLFYCEPCGEWNDPKGLVHILKEPISQFFRRVIAKEQGCIEKFNYKENPDKMLTLKTIDTLVDKFSHPAEENETHGK